ETVKSPAPISTLFKGPEVRLDSENHHEDEADLIVGILQDGLTIGGAVVSAVAKKLPFDPNQLLSMRSLLTNPPVIMALGNFACLSLIDITFKASGCACQPA
ncbi:hypothetical protein C0995_006316, partial [Termitomyces sp. Mi166